MSDHDFLEQAEALYHDCSGRDEVPLVARLAAALRDAYNAGIEDAAVEAIVAHANCKNNQKCNAIIAYDIRSLLLRPTDSL